MHPLKRLLSRACSSTHLSDLLLRGQRLLLSPMIRAVNYHDVPAEAATRFEEHLRFYREHFDDVTMDDLLQLVLHEKPLSSRRPGIVLSFDDGLSTHSTVVAPLLEKHGYTGWFFVPAGLLAESERDVPRDPCAAPYMTWAQLRVLGRRHIIGCHSMTHVRLKASLTPSEREIEIVDSKRRLEEELGREVPVFCWVGGEEWSYSRESAETIRRAGYRVSFMTNSALIRQGTDLLQLQRTNIEASYSLDVVKFQLSGILDLIYAPKRSRVNRLTRA